MVVDTIKVSEQIKNIEGHIQRLQTELVRLDGSLQVFKQMSDLGIENVPIPRDEVLE